MKTRTPRSLLLVGLVLAVGFSFPAGYLVVRNVTEGSEPLSLIASARVLEPLRRTIVLAVLVSATSALIGTAAAFITARTDVPGRRLWRVVLPVPLVFPTFVGAAAFIRALNPGGLAHDLFAVFGLTDPIELRGLFGAWFALSLFTYPYVYLPVAARLKQLPGSFEESARLLGDSPWRTFVRICWPQISTSVLAGTLLVFLYVISDFGAVQLMRYDTLTRAIATSYLGNTATSLALSLILLVLAALVVAGERRLSSRVPSTGTTRADTSLAYPLGRLRWPTFAGVASLVFVGVGAPLAALLDWSIDGLLRTRNGRRPLTIGVDTVLEATWNTASMSVAASIVAIAAVLPIAVLVGRHRSRMGTLANAIVISTFAVPGVLIALSLSFWMVRSPAAADLFRNTRSLLVFAYVVRFGSLAMGVTLLAVRAVPPGLHDVARTLGAGAKRRVSTIDAPLMVPGLLAGAGLVLLSVMKELPISLLIAPFNFSTLTTRAFSSFEDAFVAEAAILSVVLVALSAVLSWFLVLRRSEHL